MHSLNVLLKCAISVTKGIKWHKKRDLSCRAAAGSRKPIISDPNQLSLHASGSAVNKCTKIELTSLEKGTTKLYNDTCTFFCSWENGGSSCSYSTKSPIFWIFFKFLARKTWKSGHELKAVYNHQQNIVSILPLSSSRPSPRAEKITSQRLF